MTDFADPEFVPTGFAITRKRVADSMVLGLVGEMDLSTERAIKAAVATACTATDVTSVELDVDGVSFIDSSGLRSLMWARQAALDHGMRFVLRAARGGLVGRRVILSGLDKVFENRRPLAAT